MSFNEKVLSKLIELGVVVKWVDLDKNGGFKFNIEFNSDWIDDSGKVDDIKFEVEGREYRLVGGLKGKSYKESVEKIENGKVVSVEEWKEVENDYMRIVESSKVDVLDRMNSLSSNSQQLVYVCYRYCGMYIWGIIYIYIPRYF